MRWGVLRERGGATGSQAVWAGGEHGTFHRPAVSGALGGGTAQTGVAATGSGRDPPGQEAEIPDGGQQPGERRTALVRAGAQERDAGRFFQEELSARQRRGIEAACVDMW